MKCLKHKNMIVLHAFSEGNCENCDCVISTPHIPCDRICEACSIKYKLCQVCGKELTQEEVQEIIEAENNE